MLKFYFLEQVLINKKIFFNYFEYSILIILDYSKQRIAANQILQALNIEEKFQ